MKSDLKKHTLKWFINRVGKAVVKGSMDLFNPPITIQSKQHANALFIEQNKGYKFYDNQ